MHPRTRKPAAIILPAALVLAACNGSDGPGGFQATLPQLTGDVSTFAQSGETFSASTRIVRTSGTAGDVVQTTVAVRDAGDGSGDLILEDGGTDFRLVRNPNTGDYTFSNGSLTYFARAALGQSSGAILILGQSGSTTAAGFIPVARPSADIAGQTGKAVYLGPSTYIAVSTVNGAATSGSGGIIMEADFDTATVDGAIALTDTASSTEFLIGFEDAAITGSGFSTTNLTQQGLAGNVTGSSLNATFAGSGAAEASGVYTMDVDFGSDQAALAGAFVAGRQAGDLADIAANGGAVALPGGEQIVLGSGSVIGGSGSVYPDGSSSYFNSNTGVNFGADGSGCFYVSGWSNC